MLTNKLPEEVDTLLSKGQIPIIDLAHCGTEECPKKSVVNRVASQLQKALCEKGIAFLVNHGISEEKLKTAWLHLDDFCKLPNDTKELYMRKAPDNHGYIKPSQERFDGTTPELRHAFNICTLNAAILPEQPLPGFKEHIAELANDFKHLSALLLQAIAIGLDLQSNYFLENHSHMLSGNHDNETTLRLLYYPPVIKEDDNKCEMTKGRCKYSQQRCNGNGGIDLVPPRDVKTEKSRKNSDTDTDDETDDTDDNNGNISDHSKSSRSSRSSSEKEFNVTRCGAHCDYGTFTLLSQDSEGGLEAKLPGSTKWKRVGHLPGAILINTGEILSIWSQKRYPALLHRVIIPEQENVRVRGRHSMAFFCHPDNCTSIQPLDIPTIEAPICDKTKKLKRRSFKAAKDKVFTAYQLLQEKFRQTYVS
ncbi:1-aminocyclopropane-1-carboxylate oxidase-like [Contarinia nasturtii]|uniref:1-aminocyclopropane-1-carboxylate oxidase-like n=1 Tax=Contarinia nasturtii TaxID=265458 RepID=UPI0012D47FDC|nr:1-aminocyclopropane-1-carboxylate oxidase-like [Contarinia nasturtii]